MYLLRINRTQKGVSKEKWKKRSGKREVEKEKWKKRSGKREVGIPVFSFLTIDLLNETYI